VIVEDYQVNAQTLAVIPYGDNMSKIIEKNAIFFVKKKALKVMENSCKFFGSSLIGRSQGTKDMIGVNYKSPIIVEETCPIIVFPTDSPRSSNCSWICLKNIDNYTINDNMGSRITFKNGYNLDVDLSYGSLDNQVLRASRLYQILTERKMVKNINL
jgi:competence protein ComK